jgi:hypothetical protein
MIQTAGRNRDTARGLLANGRHLGVLDPPFEWVAVIAFYSAVHYVNAYIWEVTGTNLYHPARRAYVAAHPPLSGFLPQYLQLEDHARKARYTPGYQLREQDARVLTTANINDIERVVCRELGIPRP